MGQVVLLVVGAAWAAVLIPPLLRSRGQNRPNSSVTDFRDQLSSLQKVSRPVHLRSMGRSLVAGSVERSGSRTLSTGSHRSITLHAPTGRTASGARPTGSARTTGATPAQERTDEPRRRSEHHRGERTHRQLLVNANDAAVAQKRRRANVLFVLCLITACTLFLAIVTRSTPLLYGFCAVFVALAGYIYLLGQSRVREPAPREIVDVTPPAPRQQRTRRVSREQYAVDAPQRRRVPSGREPARQPAPRRRAPRQQPGGAAPGQLRPVR